MIRYGAGHNPSRVGEVCRCGQPGVMTWLDHQARRCATTCCRDLPECVPTITPAQGGVR